MSYQQMKVLKNGPRLVSYNAHTAPNARSWHGSIERHGPLKGESPRPAQWVHPLAVVSGWSPGCAVQPLQRPAT
jgi:hypothetical protein